MKKSSGSTRMGTILDLKSASLPPSNPSKVQEFLLMSMYLIVVILVKSASTKSA